MSDTKFRVEKGQHNDIDKPFDPIEKIYNIPLYLLRKALFYSCDGLLTVVNIVSYLLGFEFDYRISDKPRWNWLSNISWPRPYAGLKKE